MGNERFSFVCAEIVHLVRAGSGIEKSECRATEAEGGPASRTKRSLRQGPEMKGTQKQAALKSLKRAEYVRRHAHRRRVRFRVTKEDEKPFSRYEALSAVSLSLEDLSRDLRAQKKMEAETEALLLGNHRCSISRTGEESKRPARCSR